MPQLNILFITTVDPSGKSGANIATSEMIDTLIMSEEVRLHVICPEPLSQQYEIESASLNYLPPQSGSMSNWHLKYHPYVALHMGRTLANKDIDIVLTRLSASMILPPLISKFFNTQYFTLIRGKLTNIPTPRLAKMVLALNSSLSNEVFVAYSEIKDMVKPYRSSNKSPVRIFTNKVNPRKFRDRGLEKSRRKIGENLSPSQFVIGFVGSLQARHRVDDLIRAFSRIADSINAKLLIVGDGDQQMDLKNLCGKLSIEDKVIFTGHVPHHCVPLYISACDLLYGVIDEDDPENPIKCYEYLACSRPLLGTSCPEFKFVDEQEAGWLIDRVDPGKIASVLMDAHSKGRKERIRMGENGREFILENHTWKCLVDTIKYYAR